MNSNDPQQPREPGAPVYDKDSSHAAVPVDANHTLRTDVHEREKAEFGGFKIGSAFFGWLTAMGTTVLLTALAAAIGAAVGLGNGTTPEEAADAAAETIEDCPNEGDHGRAEGGEDAGESSCLGGDGDAREAL